MAELSHLSFPTYLQTHVHARPELRLSDPETFELFLKRSALYWRGLVITDSDLNNNPLFHTLGERSDGILWDALDRGFIRRAGRRDAAGGVVSQAEVAEDLRRRSPARYERISPDYLRRLSAACDRRDDSALAWDPADLTRIFGTRLLALLREALPGALVDRFTAKLRAGSFFGAADLETELRPGADPAEWAAVWAVVLEAYAGNVPLTYRGALPVLGLPEGEDRLLPAGPESAGEENEVERLLYAGSAGFAGSSFGSVEVDVRLPAAMPDVRFAIDYRRLAELSLAEIEELREAAEPERFMDSRFAAAGSARELAGRGAALDELTVAYEERLMRAGVLLTEQAERDAIRRDLASRRGPAASGSIELHVTARLDAEREVDLIAQATHPWTVRSTRVVLCDMQLLRRIMGADRYAEINGGGDRFYWAIKRPDFRVLSLLGNLD